MHAGERVVYPLMKLVGQQNGIKHIYAVHQNIFKFAYYSKKHWTEIMNILAYIFGQNAPVLECFVDDDVSVPYDDSANDSDSDDEDGDEDDDDNNDDNDDDDDQARRFQYRQQRKKENFRAFLESINMTDIPKLIAKMFEGTCGSRWISYARQGLKLMHRLKIVAPQKFIDLIARTICKDPEELKELCAMASCFDDHTKPSLWCLMFYFIAHHSPGGPEGETYINGLQLFGFLCSPTHRVMLSVLSTLYPIQMEWAEFFDGKTKLSTKTTCISTRILESVIFNQKILRWIANLKTNWRIIFADSLNYIEHCEWDSPESKQACINRIDDIMLEAIPKMEIKANEYFRAPIMKIGYSLCLILDPIIGPNVAFSYLKASRHFNLLPATFDFDEARIIPHQVSHVIYYI